MQWTQRTCSGCRRTLPRTLEYFHPDRHHSSGFQRRCRACTRGHFDSLNVPPVVVARPIPPPKDEATDWIEGWAVEIATATVRYAVAHDPDLLHHIADFVGVPTPETDDDELLNAA